MNRKQHRAATKQPHAELASAFSQALALHQAGRLAEAEKIYGQILKVQPNHFDSLHLVGVINLQRGNHVESVRQIDLALKINPKAAYAHNSRGNALQELNRLDEALASYDKAIALKPDYAEAQFALCMAELPILYENEPEITVRRTAYERRLNALCEAGDRSTNLADLAKGVGASQPFLLAYQGYN